MTDRGSDVVITKETKYDLIYKTGWLTVLPIGIWYIFNFLFNVGALKFYGIISGYSNMRVEVDFFSTFFIGCLCLLYFVFLYNLLEEKVKLYKLLVASSFFSLDLVLIMANWIAGIILAAVLFVLFFWFLKKNVLKNMNQCRRNIIIVTAFVSLCIFAFSSGYYYSKKYSDYYCIADSHTQNILEVMIARTAPNTGVFIQAKNVKDNEFYKDKYIIRSLVKLELIRCDIN